MREVRMVSSDVVEKVRKMVIPPIGRICPPKLSNVSLSVMASQST